jgi:pyruvate/2-oxoglutarate dehydrogenase complex dihydrolipoamide acyltransferase (E2) component
MGTRIRTIALMAFALSLALSALAWAAPTEESPAPTVAVTNAAGESGDALVPVVGKAVADRAGDVAKGEACAVEARITEATVSEDAARVVLVAELAPVESPVRYVAEATGEGETACDAAEAAAGTAMEELGVTVNAKGTVYYYDDRRPEAWVTVGGNHGLRPEAEIAFMRGGRVVAKGTVAQVRSVDAVVVPAECTPAGTIMLGDDVRVLRNGSRAALNAALGRDRMERQFTTLAITAILAGSIYAARH